MAVPPFVHIQPVFVGRLAGKGIFYMDSTRIQNAKDYAKEVFAGDSSGHDYYHTLRVWRLALRLWEEEGGDRETVELAALLHDVDDYKLFGGEMGGCTRARAFMEGQGVPAERLEAVCRIIGDVSFKGTSTKTPSSLEGRIVQDADRLDSIGAIGVARTFAYGGSRGRKLYLPDEAPEMEMTAEQYATHNSCSINHFYEKLLLLKDMMNTPSAKVLAEERHRYMEQFLQEFFAEWDGKR